MTAKDNRTSIETTVDELDAMDIGRIITFKSSVYEVVGTLILLTHNTYTEEQGFSSYTLYMQGGKSYILDGDHKVSIHKPGLYRTSGPTA